MVKFHNLLKAYEKLLDEMREQRERYKERIEGLGEMITRTKRAG